MHEKPAGQVSRALHSTAQNLPVGPWSRQTFFEATKVLAQSALASHGWQSMDVRSMHA